jgi:hypothetical protein
MISMRLRIIDWQDHTQKIAIELFSRNATKLVMVKSSMRLLGYLFLLDP